MLLNNKKINVYKSLLQLKSAKISIFFVIMVSVSLFFSSGFISTSLDTYMLSLCKPTSIQGISSSGQEGNATGIILHYVYRCKLTANGSLLEGTQNNLEPHFLIPVVFPSVSIGVLIAGIQPLSGRVLKGRYGSAVLDLNEVRMAYSV